MNPAPPPTPPVIAGRLILDSGLSASQRLILLTLPHLGGRIITATDAEIAQCAQCSKRAVGYALAAAERLGTITRVSRLILERLRPDLPLPPGRGGSRERLILLNWEVECVHPTVREGPPTYASHDALSDRKPCERYQNLRAPNGLDMPLPPRAQPQPVEALTPSLACERVPAPEIHVKYNTRNVAAHAVGEGEETPQLPGALGARFAAALATAAERERAEGPPADEPRFQLRSGSTYTPLASQGAPSRASVIKARIAWATKLVCGIRDDRSPGAILDAVDELLLKYPDPEKQTRDFWALTLAEVADGNLDAQRVIDAIAQAGDSKVRAKSRWLSKMFRVIRNELAGNQIRRK